MNAPLRQTSVEPIAALFAEHGDLIYRTLQYLGVASSSLDDALQDVFITAHRRWDSFDGRSKRRTWLYGIARRVAWRYRRNQATRGARFVLTERPIEGSDVPFDRAHARRSVQALLERLDEAKRAAFVLVEVEGFTAAEAAQLLEVPLGTVYSRVRAAWSRLRAAAQDDVALESLRVKLEPKRRRVVQRALVAGCVPSAAAASSSVVAWLTTIAALGAVVVGVIAARAGDAAPSAVRPPAPTSARPEPAPAPAVTPAARAPEPEPTVRASPPPRPARARPQPSTEAEPPPNTLADEAKLLRRAKELVRDGKPDQARALLDDHARRFPHGQLGDEREQVRKSLP
ncbi:MAG: RNA polymerase sigma factor [Nannocystaceae bacterium]|nr:RNA polymerase sigma factor [bacterium]